MYYYTVTKLKDQFVALFREIEFQLKIKEKTLIQKTGETQE